LNIIKAINVARLDLESEQRRPVAKKYIALREKGTCRFCGGTGVRYCNIR